MVHHDLIVCCSSSCCGSADDRTVHRPDWCILLFYFGPAHPSLHRDRDLLGCGLWTGQLGGLEECNYMRDRFNGIDIWIAQCYNGYSEIVRLIGKNFTFCSHI